MGGDIMFGAIAKGVIEGSLGNLLDKLVPDREGRKKFEREFKALLETGIQAEQAAEAQAQESQLEINKIEAAHRNLFVSGWRPFMGWMVVTAWGLFYLVFPIAEWGFQIAGRDMAMPEFNDKVIDGVLYTLLGMGGLRTVEKLKGKARKM